MVVGCCGDPVRHVTNLECTRVRIAFWIEQIQLTWSLSDHHSQPAIGRKQRVVRRRASGNLRYDLIGGSVQNQESVYTGLCEEDFIAVRTHVERAGSMVERDGTRLGAAGDVNDGKSLCTCLLAGRVGSLSIGGDREVVRLRHRHFPDDLVRTRVDGIYLIGP